MSADDLFHYLNTGGVIGLLVAILVTLRLKMWVPGWLYEQQQEELESWRTLALRGTQIGEKIIDQVSR